MEHKHILVVDDESQITRVLRTSLSSHGYDIRVANDGETALEIMKDWSPDLVITDLTMPGMNGIELAIALVQSIPDCKVLLFSGQASTVDLLDKARHEGHHFTLILKPVHPTDLLTRIADCLKNREMITPQLPPLLVTSPQIATPQTVE